MVLTPHSVDCRSALFKTHFNNSFRSYVVVVSCHVPSHTPMLPVWLYHKVKLRYHKCDKTTNIYCTNIKQRQIFLWKMLDLVTKVCALWFSLHWEKLTCNKSIFTMRSRVWGCILVTHSQKGGDGLRLNFIDRYRGKVSVWDCIVQASWFEFLFSDKLLPNFL